CRRPEPARRRGPRVGSACVGPGVPGPGRRACGPHGVRPLRRHRAGRHRRGRRHGLPAVPPLPVRSGCGM
ncbi:hypothetical protein PD653_4908, partial [Nocardioides sp. PD653]